METVRKPFQGVLNIIRFNWHFYGIACIIIGILLWIPSFSNPTLKFTLQIISTLLSTIILSSLCVSCYIYDLSGFYTFEWIIPNDQNISIVNIHAGFDETSALLKQKFKNSQFLVLDFYDPNKHTEVSIKRARKRYPPYPNTIQTNTSEIDLKNNSVDKIFVMLSAHEIRDRKERITFFSELGRIIKPTGHIIVTEHLRDTPNFIAYTIGCFHFHSKSSWLDTFSSSKLKVLSEIKNTPFISTYTLIKNGDSL